MQSLDWPRERHLIWEPEKIERRCMEVCSVLPLSETEVLEMFASHPRLLTCKYPGSRASASAQVIGRLMQAAAAAGISPPVPLEVYMPLALDLVAKFPVLWVAPASRLEANWSALRILGLSDELVLALVKVQPAIFTRNLTGSSMQLRAAWLEEVLGLSLLDFFTSHLPYMTHSTAKLAMRADVLKARNLWEQIASQLDVGPLLSLLTCLDRFCKRVGCTPAELDAFERQWLQTAQGRRWSGKTGARGGTPP